MVTLNNKRIGWGEPVSETAQTRGATASSGECEDTLSQYLSEMGRTRLLTPQREVELASELQSERNKFRAGLLRISFVADKALQLISDVQSGILRGDRVLDYAAGNAEAKQSILGRLPHNLELSRQIWENEKTKRSISENKL